MEPASRNTDAFAAAAIRLVLIYAAFAALWIFVSDQAIEALIRDPEQMTRIAIIKGWLFVAVTSLLLYGLVIRLLSQIRKAERQEREALADRIRLQEEVTREHGQRLALTAHCATLIEKARDIVLLIDASGRIVEANEAAEEAYGWSHDELCGMNVRDLRDSESLAEVERQWQASASPDGVLFEAIHRRRDGRIFHVEVSSRSLEIEGDLYRQSFIRDISSRKHAEDELKQRNVDLERFNRASVDRELDMIALKERINELSVELGRPPPFDLRALELDEAEREDRP